MQMHAAVESVRSVGGQGRPEWELVAVGENTPLGAVALSDLRLSNPGYEEEEVLSGGLEDNTACYGQKKKLGINMAICLASLRLSVSHRCFNSLRKNKNMYTFL